MTFDDLVFFYAIISSPSKRSTTSSRRKTLKNFFDNALKTYPEQTAIALLNTNFKNQTSDQAITEILEGKNSNQATLISRILNEIANDFKKAVIDVINAHKTENDDFSFYGYQSYLDERCKEAYPQIENYQSILIQYNAQALHPKKIAGATFLTLVEKPSDMPSSPSINPNRFFEHPNQPLIKKDEKPSSKNCCQLL